MKVYCIHLIRTDTTKDGDGAPQRIYANENDAREFCKKKNTNEIKENSLMYVVREYTIIFDPQDIWE